MSKKTLFFFIRLTFLASLVVFLFRPETFGFREDLFQDITPMSLLKVLREAGTGDAVFWLTFAVTVKLGGILAGIIRWRLLLEGQGISLPFWYLAKCWFMGRAIGLWLPGTIGLDGYRLVESAAYTGEGIKCTTVIAVEKLIGIIALGLLVFLTLPLGMRVLNFNPVMLGVVLSIIFSFISVSFLVLLNPRIVQVLVSVVPTPPAIRVKLEKLGVAITAYSGQRGRLLLAVFFGFCVHLGIVLMYFGTASALRVENTSLLDIFFASPLVIVASVIGPTVSGAGVREVGFALLLGAKSGAAQAAMFGHLGLWVGEAIPYLLSLPLLLFTTRPDKEDIKKRMEAVRQATGAQQEAPHLAPEAVRAYRSKMLRSLGSGLAGGLMAGALIGLGEAAWIGSTLSGLNELAAYWWGPLVYGLLFAGVGLGIASVLTFFYLLVDRFASGPVNFALCGAGAMACGTLVIGRFRYQRDVLSGHAMNLTELLTLAGLTAVLALAIMGIFWLAGRLVAKRPLAASAGGLVFYGAAIAFGAVLSGALTPQAGGLPFVGGGTGRGANVIFIGVDALRADYLPMYSDDAKARTPQLQTFAQDAVVFEEAFAHSSWTKPSFATLFSGLYPGSHTATTKTSMLPEDVATFPETLREGGYYTKGFANNPNITAIFNFEQGFVDYVDLKPNLYFGASPSASKLSMYEVLRRVRQQIESRLTGGRMAVADFYQPAEKVTELALEWLEKGERPSDAPFFLFLHYMDPHDPFMDRENPGVGYARVRMPSPEPDAFLDKMVHAYNQEIEHLDTHLGALFEGLRKQGLYDDTVIVLTADHGEEFFDHSGWWHGQTLYDEVVHVPLLVKLPGNALGGTVNTDFARHIDIAPTILHLAGIEAPQSMTGIPLIYDGANNNDLTKYIYAEVDFEGNVLQSVRTRETKLIHVNKDNNRNMAPIEFYALDSDPAEQSNVAGADALIEAPLKVVLDDMEAFIKENAAEPSLLEGTPEELESQLEALGYL